MILGRRRTTGPSRRSTCTRCSPFHLHKVHKLSLTSLIVVWLVIPSLPCFFGSIVQWAAGRLCSDWRHVRLAQGYCYILTHPGTPCLFYDHLWTDGILRPSLWRRLRSLLTVAALRLPLRYAPRVMPEQHSAELCACTGLDLMPVCRLLPRLRCTTQGSSESFESKCNCTVTACHAVVSAATACRH